MPCGRPERPEQRPERPSPRHEQRPSRHEQLPSRYEQLPERYEQLHSEQLLEGRQVERGSIRFLEGWQLDLSRYEALRLEQNDQIRQLGAENEVFKQLLQEKDNEIEHFKEILQDRDDQIKQIGAESQHMHQGIRQDENSQQHHQVEQPEQYEELKHWKNEIHRQNELYYLQRGLLLNETEPITKSKQGMKQETFIEVIQSSKTPFGEYLISKRSFIHRV